VDHHNEGTLKAGQPQAWGNASMVPIGGCSGCATTGGRMACLHHGPQAQGIKVTFFACQGSPTHDFAVGERHAVCNRCEKVIEF
jgi:hypothetical protein